MLDDPDCAGAQSKIFMSFQPELPVEMVVGEGLSCAAPFPAGSNLRGQSFSSFPLGILKIFTSH